MAAGSADARGRPATCRAPTRARSFGSLNPADMRPRSFAPLLALGVLLASPLGAQSIETTYRAAADSLINAALKDSAAWNRLAKLTDTFGNRLSGSDALERTIDWVLAEMKRDGLEN